MCGLRNHEGYGIKKLILILGVVFTRRKVDHCMYFKLVGDHNIYFLLHVDDMWEMSCPLNLTQRMLVVKITLWAQKLKEIRKIGNYD